MQKKTFSVQPPDGRTLAAFAWLPDTAPTAVIQLSHGMCEYTERYERLAQAAVEQGFAFVGHDHMGHGKTAPSPEDLGFFAHRDGWKLFAADLHTVTLRIKEDLPGVPIVLLAHSMGSFIGRVCLNGNGGDYAAAVISGTAGKNPVSAIGKLLTKTIALFKGERYRSAFIKNMAFAGYCDRCEEKRTDCDWLTRDAAVVDRYKVDPFCNYTFTVSGYHDLMSVLDCANSKKGVSELKKDLPVLFVAGENDPVGAYGKGVSESAQRMRDAGCTDIRVKMYPLCRHELHNELIYEKYYSDLFEFVRETTQK